MSTIGWDSLVPSAFQNHHQTSILSPFSEVAASEIIGLKFEVQSSGSIGRHERWGSVSGPGHSARVSNLNRSCQLPCCSRCCRLACRVYRISVGCIFLGGVKYSKKGRSKVLQWSPSPLSLQFCRTCLRNPCGKPEKSNGHTVRLEITRRKAGAKKRPVLECHKTVRHPAEVRHLWDLYIHWNQPPQNKLALVSVLLKVQNVEFHFSCAHHGLLHGSANAVLRECRPIDALADLPRAAAFVPTLVHSSSQ